MTTTADRPRAPERCSDPNCKSTKPPVFIDRTEHPTSGDVQDNYECAKCKLPHAVNVTPARTSKKAGGK